MRFVGEEERERKKIEPKYTETESGIHSISNDFFWFVFSKHLLYQWIVRDEQASLKILVWVATTWYFPMHIFYLLACKRLSESLLHQLATPTFVGYAPLHQAVNSRMNCIPNSFSEVIKNNKVNANNKCNLIFKLENNIQNDLAHHKVLLKIRCFDRSSRKVFLNK